MPATKLKNIPIADIPPIPEAPEIYGPQNLNREEARIKEKPLRFLLLASFLLTCTAFMGCTTYSRLMYKPYLAPVTGDTARLRLIKTAGNAVAFSSVTPCKGGERFTIGELIAGASSSSQDPRNPKSLGMPGQDTTPNLRGNFYTETIIPGNHPFNGVFYYENVFANGLGGTVTETCEVLFKFTPKKDHDYEARLEIYRGEMRKCFVQLRELSKTAEGKIIRTPIQQDILDPGISKCSQ